MSSRPAARKPGKGHSRSGAVTLAAVGTLLGIVGAVIVSAYLRVPSDQIAPGVFVGNIDLGGLTKEQAEHKLSELDTSLGKQRFSLEYQSPVSGKVYHWSLTAMELGLHLDNKLTLAAALEYGRRDAVARVAHLFDGKQQKHLLPPSPTADRTVLESAIKKIAHALNRQPGNPHMAIDETGQFKISPGKSGTQVDLKATGDVVISRWNQRLSQPGFADSAEEEPSPVDITVREVTPSVSEQDLTSINGPISEMKTRIRGTSQRVRNVTLATQHIDGTLLAPGDTFSYNKVVGRRSEEGGYKKAIIFVKGRHVEDIGGGICQTASTLYNAVLKAGLKVVRRQPHCTPVIYVPYGLDATVAYGAVDFQFENDTDHPVYIYAKAKGRSLTFRLYSKQDAARRVVLEKLQQSTSPTSTQVVQDKTLPPGKRVVRDKGALGYRIVWRRTIYEGDKQVHTETISSHYRPVPAIVAVGPGTPPAPGPVAPPQPAGLPGSTPAPSHGAVPVLPASGPGF